MSFRLASSAFENRGILPSWYTRRGVDSSPPLGWTSPPEQTRSFSLICSGMKDDKMHFHWVIYNIPPTERSLYGKQPQTGVLPSGACQGKNGFDTIGWTGPGQDCAGGCLTFVLYAIDSILDLPDPSTGEDLSGAIEGHVLAEARLTAGCR